MRHIGLHLRLDTTLVHLIEKALRLNVDFFQCFLTLKTAGRIISLSNGDMQAFIELRRKYFKDLYVHISYWVNFSSIKHHSHVLLHKEFTLAKKLEFTHLILHPGSAKGARYIPEGIDALAKMLNRLIKQEPDFIFVLENVAQKFPTVGGDIEHFRLLLEKLDNVDRVRFCIDTAHAFSYGYNIKNRETFIELLDKKIGLERICLIHVNDNQTSMGSQIDKHAPLGEGVIGLEALKNFVEHPKLAQIPILSEPPIMLEEKLKKELEKMRSWSK